MKTLAWALGIGLLLLPGPDTHAQELARAYVLTPAPGQDLALRDALADQTDWLEEQGDEWNWGVFQVVAGPRFGTWVLRSGGHDWADFDERAQELGPRAVQRFRARVLPLVESIEMEVTRSHPVLTTSPSEGDYRLFEIFEWRVRDVAAFNEATARALESYEQGGVTYNATYRTVLHGADVPATRRIRFYRDWADFSNAPATVEIMSDAYGEEETLHILNSIAESSDGGDRWVVRYYPELSKQAEN